MLSPHIVFGDLLSVPLAEYVPGQADRDGDGSTG